MNMKINTVSSINSQELLNYTNIYLHITKLSSDAQNNNIFYFQNHVILCDFYFWVFGKIKHKSFKNNPLICDNVIFSWTILNIQKQSAFDEIN